MIIISYTIDRETLNNHYHLFKQYFKSSITGIFNADVNIRLNLPDVE